ncbi:MAG: MFS transporter [Pseudomonadota bacterium]
MSHSDARHSGKLSRYYSWYVLALLWVVALLRFVDLQIVAVLLEPIKAEFQLTDTQLSLLGGLAFALFYGTLGIPVAWLAERYSRRTIIACAVALWSFMTALCGQAGGFASFFLARMGVGIGEAGAYPPSTSLLADYFAPAQRGRAYAILASAIPVGVLTGFLIGGFVSQWYGWRVALQVVGLPGLLIGLLVYCTVREPVRGNTELRSNLVRQETFLQSCRMLWQQSAYRYVVLAACTFTLGATGSGIWLPTYFMRHHGMSGPEIGLWMAGLYGGGGLLGSLLGGWLGERLDKDRSGCAYAHVSQWSLLCTLPLLPLVLLSSSAHFALCCHLGVTVLMHMNIGPVLTLLQHIGGVQRRALAQAFSVLVSNLVALPLGPLFVGMFSDHFSATFGTQTLGLAILLFMATSWSLSAWLFTTCGVRLAARHDATINGMVDGMQRCVKLL